MPTEQAAQRYGAALNRVPELIVASTSGLLLKACRTRSEEPEWHFVSVSDALRNLGRVDQLLTVSPHFPDVGDTSEKV